MSGGGVGDLSSGGYKNADTCLCLDMILTDEWTREVAKHEKTINELERRYEEKCKALKVCFVPFIIRLQQYARSNWLLRRLLRGYYFLACMTWHS